MESIIRNNEDGRSKEITLEDFYDKILRGKEYPDFYRQVSLLILSGEKQQEFLIMETLGKGSSGFVFLAYYQRKLTALKMSYENREKNDIFLSLEKTNGDNYRNYFLNRTGKTIKINGIYIPEKGTHKNIPFDRDVFITCWEPADATMAEKLSEDFDTKVKWFRQFLQGLQLIHSRSRAHFDIKLENLFLVGNQLKIGDFEFYAKINDFKNAGIICGTPGHIAPEMFTDRENISTRVDIFSAGIAFARLFTGQDFKGHAPLSHGRTRTDTDNFLAFSHGRTRTNTDNFLVPQAAATEVLSDGHEFITDEDFKVNFKISHFYKSLVKKELETLPTTGTQRIIYQLLLDMIEIDPQKRPGADELLKQLDAIPGDPVLTGTIQPMGKNIVSGGVEKDSFAKLLQTHDKKQLIKYCLVPDLLEKLSNDKIKTKIMGIRFNCNDEDDYIMDFFSFIPLEHETQIQLFGKQISSRQVKNHKEWNMLVIIDYWNKIFALGLEMERDQAYINRLLEGKELDALQYDVFQSQIKTTGKKIFKIQRLFRKMEA